MPTPTAIDKIQEHQAAIEELRKQAIRELQDKKSALLKEVEDLDDQIAALGGSKAVKGRRTRKTISIEEIKSAIKSGNTNYKQVAAALGCSAANVANKIKKEGKKAGIKSKGNKANFTLFAD